MQPINAHFVDFFNKTYQAGKIEDALLALRNAGAHMVDTVRVLMHILNLKLPEADDIVVHSSTWSDMKTMTIDIRDTFAKALEQLDNETI